MPNDDPTLLAHERYILNIAGELAEALKVTRKSPRDWNIEIVASINEEFENRESPFRIVELGVPL